VRAVDFPLSDELMGQLIHAMEDQQHRFLIHRTSGEIVRADQAPQQRGEYVPLPPWRPIDGFQLMERFVSRLHNPVYRTMLREALAAGKGVFRKFKDILREQRELEHLWLVFKERELRRIIGSWYNDQREMEGLSRLELEPQEDSYEELLETDFAVVEAGEAHVAAIGQLDRQAFAEAHPGADPGRLEECFRERRRALPPPLEEGSVLLAAVTADGTFAGFAWAVEREEPLTGALELELLQLAVVPRFRGLGLGTMLLRQLAATARDGGYARLGARLEAGSLALQPLFEELGFRPESLRLALDPTGFEE
jgi:ribosomal protein S18 acetylase RimI-like enzyme